jgi:RHS repeat-associated protein
VTDTYDYDAFGNVVGSTGTTANVYRYQGEALDGETGLCYMRARYYDPAAGRFLSVDPMADEGEHPYSYAGADPVNGHDPTGTQEVLEATLLLADITLPSVPYILGVEESVNCIWGLTSSMLTATGVIRRVAACRVAGSNGGSSEGGGGGGGNGGGQPPNDPGIGCGSNGRKSMNYDQARAAWDSARRRLNPQSMAKKKNCQKLASSCGITIDQWMSAVNAVQFSDGTTSSTTMASLYAGGATLDIRALGPLRGSQTVSQYLAGANQKSTEGSAKPCALSQLGGHDVYLNYPAIDPGDIYKNQADVLHEALHNVTGLTDPYLQNRLHVKVGALSGNISDKIGGSCL